MTKRRRGKKNVASKVDAVNKGKTSVQVKTNLEKDDEKVTCVETPQPSDAKKQKLDTGSNRTDSSPETEKYVPPFTAAQRVVRVPRDKLQLNKTKINSQENSSTEEGKELKSDDTASNEENKICSENNADVMKEPVKEKEQEEDDLVGNEKLESKEVEISASNSLSDGKEKTMSVVEYDKDKEPILETNESVEIPNKHPLESDQMIVNTELSNDVEAIKLKSQADEVKPVNDPRVVEVPKLSFLIKKYYVDLEPQQDLKVEPVVPMNTSNLLNTDSHQEKVEESEKDEEKEIASTVHEESESKPMDMVDDQILSQPNATEQSNVPTCSQSYRKKQVIVSTSAKTDCVQKENGKNATTENTLTDLAKNDEDVPSDDLQSKIFLTSDDVVDKQSADQRVPDDFAIQECQTVVSGSNTTQEAVDPDEKNTTLSFLNESNCEKTKTNETGIGVMTSVALDYDVVDKQSFAKEFEELEELLPKDDMGLFDDVMDDQSMSDAIEIPNGDSTMQFLIDELSSLNYMVLNYQRTTDEMKRQYKFSGNRC